MQVSVVLVVFILLLFNLGGWFVWKISQQRLDERLDRQLVEAGRSLRVYLEQLPLQAGQEIDDASLLDASLYLQQIARESALRRLFLFDPQGRVWFDSREEVEPGQGEPLLEADREQLEQLWQGQPATTPFYPIEQGHAKRAYVPLRDATGKPVWGLALEAGSTAFSELAVFRRALRTLALASAVVALGAVLVLVQVVQRARHLEEIVSRTERALEAGQLTAALAHELRNPLGIIHTNAEVLREQVSPDQQGGVRDILEETERLSSLISRFLDLSSQKPAEWAPCSLGALAEKVLSRHKAKTQALGIEVELKRPAEGDEVLAQADRLESVLDNLIANAEQALESPSPRSPASSHGARRSAARRIEVEVQARRRTVVMEVRDTGPGLSGEALRMAVQPFYSGRAQGTGLGLAIVRRIVEDHGGTLKLQNRPAGGASVCLTFKRTG